MKYPIIFVDLFVRISFLDNIENYKNKEHKYIILFTMNYA